MEAGQVREGGEGLQTFIESGHKKMDTVYTVVEAVSRMSDLLHINLEAVCLSLDSLAVLLFHFANAAGFAKVCVCVCERERERLLFEYSDS
jgi:hypothetical protein